MSEYTYDELFVDVGSHLLEAENLLDAFLFDVLDKREGEFLVMMDNLLSHRENKGTISKVFLTLKGDIKVVLIGEKEFFWKDCSLLLKNEIANYIHLQMISDEIVNNLNCH